MKQAYPTFIVESKGDYLVYVPDLEIYTQGEDLADAIHMARDAIGLKVIVLENEGIEVTMPTSPSDAISKAKKNSEDIDFTKGVFTLVDVDFFEYRRINENRTIRRNVSLPNWLDVAAKKAEINVSGVLQEALMKVLGDKKPH